MPGPTGSTRRCSPSASTPPCGCLPIPPIGEKVKPGLRSVIDGLAFIATRPVLLMSFAVDIAAMVLAMPRALFPELAVDRFHDVGAVGWLFAAIAIGSVVAGLFSGWIGRVRRQGMALIIAVVVWGAAVALAGLAHSLWLAVLLLAVGGAADLVSAVYRQTILQTYAPDQMRGRLQGVFTVVVAGGPRLGDLRAGVTAAGGRRHGLVGRRWRRLHGPGRRACLRRAGPAALPDRRAELRGPS